MTNKATSALLANWGPVLKQATVKIDWKPTSYFGNALFEVPGRFLDKPLKRPVSLQANFYIEANGSWDFVIRDKRWDGKNFWKGSEAVPLDNPTVALKTLERKLEQIQDALASADPSDSFDSILKGAGLR